jgi:hypothetical protein
LLGFGAKVKKRVIIDILVEAWERRKAEENFIRILKYLYSTILHSDIMSEQISSRLPPKFVSEIESLVNEGYYLSTSDFVREAVREKLKRRFIAFHSKIRTLIPMTSPMSYG